MFLGDIVKTFLFLYKDTINNYAECAGWRHRRNVTD
jgi:hypothetical protein